jgi:hypothetical protein
MPGYGVLPADEGEGLLPWSWAEERLARSRSFWLSTVGRDRRPHAMPVWGVWQAGALYFSTGAETKKARNLAGNSACVVTTELPHEAVVVEGTASLVPGPAPAVATAYRSKYGMAYPADSRLYRVAPRKAFALIDDDSRFIATATRWAW